MCRSVVALFVLLVSSPVASAETLLPLYSETVDAVASPTYSTTRGNVAVAPAASPFPTKSLEFNTQGNPGDFFYDQIQFRVDYVNSPYLGISHRRFHVGFDIYLKELIGTPNHFSVFLDTPTAKALRFEGNGDVVVQNHGYTTLSQYAELQSMHVDMVLDLDQQRLSIAIDGQQVYSAASDSEKLQSVRFSLGATSSGIVDHAAYAYVDNINVSAIVPEPSSISLAATTVIGCVAGGRYVHCSPRRRQLICDSSCGKARPYLLRLFTRR